VDEPAPKRGPWRVARDLTVRTLVEAREDRLLGLGAELAFFALLAIPPTLFVLAALIGAVGDLVGQDVRPQIAERLADALGGFLSGSARETFIAPTVDRIVLEGHSGILSFSVVIALFSSSRLARVLIEALNITYDVREWRSPAVRRLVALRLMAGGFLAAAIYLPFLVGGPNLGDWLDRELGIGHVAGFVWSVVYWPVAAGLGIAMLATLYHAAPNWGTPWRRDLPGAALAAGLWVAAAFGMRTYVSVTVSESAFGPFAAPVVLMLWLYAISLAVLLGAELNGEIEKAFPSSGSGPKASRVGPAIRRVRGLVRRPGESG